MRSKRYVIQNTENRRFIDLDLPSGGYPHEVSDPFSARLWDRWDEAYKYKQVFHDKPWVILVAELETRLE